jgi:hypothetical protein
MNVSRAVFFHFKFYFSSNIFLVAFECQSSKLRASGLICENMFNKACHACKQSCLYKELLKTHKGPPGKKASEFKT